MECHISEEFSEFCLEEEFDRLLDDSCVTVMRRGGRSWIEESEYLMMNNMRGRECEKCKSCCNVENDLLEWLGEVR